MHLVVNNRVFLIVASGEGERGAHFHLEGDRPRDVKQDRVAARGGTDQNGDLVALRWSRGRGLGLAGGGRAAVGPHPARGGVDGEEHLLGPNFRNLYTALI